MISERIQELLQILWEEAQTHEGLQTFVEKYGDELDEDFLTGILAVIAKANEDGNEDVARFFNQMGEFMLTLVMPSDVVRRSAAKTDEARYLIRILLEKVNSPKDLDHFAAEYMNECDEAFFAVLEHVIAEEKNKGNEGNAKFLEQVGQTLQQVRGQAEQASVHELEEGGVK
ncbi:hypothetical protein [Desulfonema magnum]|uniref:Uncharacterized protein n=1 Tax=Desulfonema magnum TaxID=45655 RepID=A0A975GNX8_9BACT|nr:hypothetical protein [Desulfonema magnum]QTA88244.1 Uncharacterized protein dnm_042860 [Desulfonema magnum]